MILLHKLTHAREPFHLNPDVVVTVEPRPDTVIVLATGARIVVAESPGEVADAIRAYRVGVLRAALEPA